MAQVTATRTTYTAAAKRWKHGWELHVDGVGVTQSKTLLDAEGMARDYIAIVLDVPEDSFAVEVKPEMGAGIDGELLTLQEADQAVAKAQQRATAQRESVTRALVAEGLSGREIAKLLGISPQRVSQLLSRVGLGRNRLVR